MASDKVLYAEYISVKEQSQKLNKRLSELRKKVTVSMESAMNASGENSVCISQHNSDKILELKSAPRLAPFNMRFVQDALANYITSHGQLEIAGIDEFAAFVDTERKKNSSILMRLSYRKRPGAKKRKNGEISAVASIPSDVADADGADDSGDFDEVI